MPTLPAYRPVIPYERHRVTTDDGVQLAVQSVGRGPCVILANGIGVTVPGLDPIAHQLRRRYRVVCWDYRHTGNSHAPKTRLDLSVERHATDALQILTALGEERAVVLGWSMGVPLGLEMIRQAPNRVAGYGALFGAAGQPFRAAFRWPLSEMVHMFFRFSNRVPWPTQAVLRLGATIPSLAWIICSTIKFVGKEAHQEIFHADVCSTTNADKSLYFGTMVELLEHDASDILPAIRCPALIVAGTDDWLTPPEAAEEMARAIPGAELVVLQDTSHFGVIEHGPTLWGPIGRLLQAAYPNE
jgi:pimeloyl-ACP methyl ester carboxylesterase